MLYYLADTGWAMPVGGLPYSMLVVRHMQSINAWMAKEHGEPDRFHAGQRFAFWYV